MLGLDVLALDTLAIAREDLVDGLEQAFFGEAIIAVGRQRERDLIPDKIGPGNLLEKVSTRLKDDRIGEDDDTPGGLAIVIVAAEFHQRQLHQPDIDDIAGHARDLHAIANLDAEFADEEEISRQRQDRSEE